jgi:hypothetical protein
MVLLGSRFDVTQEENNSKARSQTRNRQISDLVRLAPEKYENVWCSLLISNDSLVAPNILSKAAAVASRKK